MTALSTFDTSEHSVIVFFAGLGNNLNGVVSKAFTESPSSAMAKQYCPDSNSVVMVELYGLPVRVYATGVQTDWPSGRYISFRLSNV